MRKRRCTKQRTWTAGDEDDEKPELDQRERETCRGRRIEFRLLPNHPIEINQNHLSI